MRPRARETPAGMLPPVLARLSAKYHLSMSAHGAAYRAQATGGMAFIPHLKPLENQ